MDHRPEYTSQSYDGVHPLRYSRANTGAKVVLFQRQVHKHDDVFEARRRRRQHEIPVTFVHAVSRRQPRYPTTHWTHPATPHPRRLLRTCGISDSVADNLGNLVADLLLSSYGSRDRSWDELASVRIFVSFSKGGWALRKRHAASRCARNMARKHPTYRKKPEIRNHGLTCREVLFITQVLASRIPRRSDSSRQTASNWETTRPPRSRLSDTTQARAQRSWARFTTTQTDHSKVEQPSEACYAGHVDQPWTSLHTLEVARTDGQMVRTGMTPLQKHWHMGAWIRIARCRSGFRHPREAASTWDWLPAPVHQLPCQRILAYPPF